MAGTVVASSIQQIVLLANKREVDKPLFIAIDGHSAAGKSTLAHNLADSMEHAVVIHTDDFYRPMDLEARFGLNAQEGYEQYCDWQRLRDEVLAPLSASTVASYGVYDWQSNQLGMMKSIEPAEIVIVEGCYSARPELVFFFDLVVLVETDIEERQRRQAERNESPQEWMERWDAAERFYIESTNLRDRADFVVVGG